MRDFSRPSQAARALTTSYGLSGLMDRRRPAAELLRVRGPASDPPSSPCARSTSAAAMPHGLRSRAASSSPWSPSSSPMGPVYSPSGARTAASSAQRRAFRGGGGRGRGGGPDIAVARSVGCFGPEKREQAQAAAGPNRRRYADGFSPVSRRIRARRLAAVPSPLHRATTSKRVSPRSISRHARVIRSPRATPAVSCPAPSGSGDAASPN